MPDRQPLGVLRTRGTAMMAFSIIPAKSFYSHRIKFVQCGRGAKYRKSNSAGASVPAEHGRLHIDQPVVLPVGRNAQFGLQKIGQRFNEGRGPLFWKGKQL